MNKNYIQLTSNWCRSGGCDFREAFLYQTADPDVFIKPPLDELLDENRAILLSNPKLEEEKCELCVELFPHYKIQAFNMVCNVPKIEIFQGPLKEYMETVYGFLINEEDEEPDTHHNLELQCYRYDIEVDKSGVTEIAIRFLTGLSEVCIFGIYIQIAPNPNGITSLMPNTIGKINVENVQNMLENSMQKTTPSAEKYKKFLEAIIKSGNSTPAKGSALINQNFKALNQHDEAEAKLAQMNSNNDKTGGFDMTMTYLMERIDLRFKEFENVIQQRINDMEQRQSAKLDKILNLLEKQEKSN
uniref:Uncharacterized protein n=1 Tax=Glossina brevipalpis TaxID=37001 RepID=A0A1A9WTQ6_9MUSC